MDHPVTADRHAKLKCGIVAIAIGPILRETVKAARLAIAVCKALQFPWEDIKEMSCMICRH